MIRGGVVSIPDNDAAGGVSTIEVTEDIDLTTLKVTVAITHTYIGDLTLTLRRGTEEYELQKNAGEIAGKSTMEGENTKPIIESLVEIKANVQQLEASTKVLQVSDEMIGTLLDIRA